MAQINITITAPLATFSSFADGLGYQPMISKTPEEIALLPQPVSIADTLKPNPQSKTEFLLAYLKTITVNKLAEQQTNAIESATRADREAEKQTIKANIASAINVTLA